MKSKIHTPWGPSQYVRVVAPGIRFISTASHGGYKVDEELLSRIPEPYRDGTPFSPRGWFEEDDDASIVILAFPEHFSQVGHDGKTPYQHAVADALRRANSKYGGYLKDLAEVFGLLKSAAL